MPDPVWVGDGPTQPERSATWWRVLKAVLLGETPELPMSAGNSQTWSGLHSCTVQLEDTFAILSDEGKELTRHPYYFVCDGRLLPHCKI